MGEFLAGPESKWCVGNERLGKFILRRLYCWRREKSIVVSYASSPIAELIYSDPPVEIPPTGIIEDSCFKQVEYAGIVKNTQNKPEAEALIDFLLSQRFQEDIPLNMFMMPVLAEAFLPTSFSTYPTIPGDLNEISPKEIEANRNDWTQIWTETVLR